MTEFKKAFIKTVPILFGYLFLGSAFGVLIQQAGYNFIWAFFATFTNYFLGIVMALLINKKSIKLKKLWRTALVLSIAVPQFVSLLSMNKFLSKGGYLNKF